jgi:hypothetical protein
MTAAARTARFARASPYSRPVTARDTNPSTAR